jgi:hypothetical protein
MVDSSFKLFLIYQTISCLKLSTDLSIRTYKEDFIDPFYLLPK